MTGWPSVGVTNDTVGAGMVNIPKLKGIHLAMHAGMFAAESIFERLIGAMTRSYERWLEVTGTGIASALPSAQAAAPRRWSARPR